MCTRQLSVEGKDKDKDCELFNLTIWKKKTLRFTRCSDLLHCKEPNRNKSNCINREWLARYFLVCVCVKRHNRIFRTNPRSRQGLTPIMIFNTFKLPTLPGIWDNGDIHAGGGNNSSIISGSSNNRFAYTLFNASVFVIRWNAGNVYAHFNLMPVHFANTRRCGQMYYRRRNDFVLAIPNCCQ